MEKEDIYVQAPDYHLISMSYLFDHFKLKNESVRQFQKRYQQLHASFLPDKPEVKEIVDTLLTTKILTEIYPLYKKMEESFGQFIKRCRQYIQEYGLSCEIQKKLNDLIQILKSEKDNTAFILMKNK